MILPNNIKVEYPWNTNSDFVVDMEGNLYILSDHFRILKYNATGKIVNSIEFDTSLQTHLMATDVNNRLYVKDLEQVYVYNSIGKLVETIETPKMKSYFLQLISDGKVIINYNFDYKKAKVACMRRNRHIAGVDNAIFLSHMKCNRRETIPIDDEFIDSKGNNYKYEGFFNGIVKRAPNGSVLQKFRPSWFILLFTMPLIWIIAAIGFIISIIVRPQLFRKN